jgi:flagellar biosynthesis protein FliP
MRRKISLTKLKRVIKPVASLAFFMGIFSLLSPPAYAAPSDVVQTIFGENAQTLDIVILMTGLMLIPTMLIMLTGFTRIVIVLSFVRNAIGMQNMPPNMVIIGLSLFLTYFVMNPVLTQIYDTAYTPYVAREINLEEFGEKAMEPLRDFMLKQTYESDLDFFSALDGLEQVDDYTELPNRVIIPSFMTSELKHAFQIGFFIYIPFIVIDMVVASTLMAMGMMMLPPAMISLPFKVLLFVLVDGWQLTFGTLIKSFG